MENIDEIVVVVGGDNDIDIINSISERTFKNYVRLGKNKLKIEEKSGHITICEIEPHNTHVYKAVKRWKTNNRYIINLQNTQTGKFAKDEFLHSDARDKLLHKIMLYFKLHKYNQTDKRSHNTILIDGKRGYGKTSFMLSMIDLIQDKHKEGLYVLELIDPTIVETKENIFILVLSLIKKEVEKVFGDYCNDINTEQKRDFNNSLKELSSGLNVLDGVGSDSLFKESVWNESELILEDALKDTKGGNDLENNFKKFIEISLNILNKKAFMLVFDDIDTASNQGKMILELIRKYFTSPKLLVVLLGDIDLFNLIVRDMQWKKLNPENIQKYEVKLINEMYSKEIDTLTQQYLIKILKDENIIKLKRVYDIYKDIDIVNNGGMYKSSLEEYLQNMIISRLFNETDISKVKIFLDFMLKLPLRTIVQILSANGDMVSLQHTLLSDINYKYTNNIVQLLEALKSNQNDKFYQLYKFILNLKDININNTFLPMNNDNSKNNLYTILNAYISNSIYSVQDLFDYFGKFYMPLEFGCDYDYNTHTFKVLRYSIKTLRTEKTNQKIHKGTIQITNDEFKKLNLSEEEQALFNIFIVGLFTKRGLQNYFSYWNLFGFLSDIFYFEKNINLDKLLQVKSFYLEELEDEYYEETKSDIQEASYSSENLIHIVKNTIEQFEVDENEILDIGLSTRQLSSIWTRVEYSVKYIDENPSAKLSEQLQRYINATINAFLVVVLENEKGIKFNNALSINSSILKNNLEVLKQNKAKYLWLDKFVDMEIWEKLKNFTSRLDTILLSFDFINEFSEINFEGALSSIKDDILQNDENLLKSNITKVINSIKQRKSIDKKVSSKLIKELEKIRDKAKVKNDNN
jgi:hypothetical protein